MITVEHSTAFAYPPERVFAAVADLAGHPAWQPEVLDVALAGDAPVGAGTRIVQTRKVMGRRTEIALTVTEYEPDTRLTLATDAGARPGVSQAYTVVSEGNGRSRCDFRLDLDGVPRLAEHLVRAQLGKQVPELFRRLAAILAGS